MDNVILRDDTLSETIPKSIFFFHQEYLNSEKDIYEFSPRLQKTLYLI